MQRVQLGRVVVAAECFEHSSQVAGSGDLRSKTIPDRLAGSSSTEVLIAARSDRLGDQLQLALGGRQPHDVLFEQVAARVQAASRSSRAELVEGREDSIEVGWTYCRRDVDSSGDLVAAVQHSGQAADEYVGDLVALEGAQKRVGVERRRCGHGDSSAICSSIPRSLS